jgi:predicted metal-dependent hydrolase
MEETFDLRIQGCRVPIRVIRERRPNTRAAIGANAVILRLPLLLSKEQKQAQINWLEDWLLQIMTRKPELLKRFQPRQYQHGEVLVVGERHYTLHIEYSDKMSHRGQLQCGVIRLQLSTRAPEDTVGQLLSRLIAKDYLPDIIARVAILNSQFFRKKVNTVALKHTRSRWGSCSSRGNINLSTRLLFAPTDVQDYVIIHELAHLAEANHSPRFWKLVREAMPDYKNKEKWLQDNAHLCRF